VNLTRCPVYSCKTPFLCGVDNGAVCTSHAAPFPLAKHLFSAVSIMGQCESHAALFPLTKHPFSAVLMIGWCAPHTPPHFSPESHFFCSINDQAVYKNGSMLLLFAHKLAACEFDQICILTCSPYISTTSTSFPIILIYLECTCWELLHNVICVPKSLIIKFPVRDLSSGTVHPLVSFPG